MVRNNLSRRDFLKLAAAGLLAGCAPQITPTPTSQPPATSVPSPTTQPSETPTVQPTQTPAAQPAADSVAPIPDTPTPAPSAMPTSLPTPTPGKVVRARHTGVWSGDTLETGALDQMLAAAITALTGFNDARSAWAALFKPGERVAIKINTIGGSSYWTHAPLVSTIVAKLQDAGLPAEHIVIFDRSSRELADAGYTVNRDGAGVRCYGTDRAYTSGWDLLGTNVSLSDVLLSCDALINIPVLKTHGTAGFSFALKNHYGTFDKPGQFHGNIVQALGALNALDAIRDRTRLIVGDVLTVCTRSWNDAVAGDSILMSRDPVALDAVGLQMFMDAAQADGVNPARAQKLGPQWLAYAAGLGLGVAPGQEVVSEVQVE